MNLLWKVLHSLVFACHVSAISFWSGESMDRNHSACFRNLFVGLSVGRSVGPPFGRAKRSLSKLGASSSGYTESCCTSRNARISNVLRRKRHKGLFQMLFLQTLDSKLPNTLHGMQLLKPLLKRSIGRRDTVPGGSRSALWTQPEPSQPSGS